MGRIFLGISHQEFLFIPNILSPFIAVRLGG
jgi:hypothetical protein